MADTSLAAETAEPQPFTPPGGPAPELAEVVPEIGTPQYTQPELQISPYGQVAYYMKAQTEDMTGYLGPLEIKERPEKILELYNSSSSSNPRPRNAGSPDAPQNRTVPVCRFEGLRAAGIDRFMDPWTVQCCEYAFLIGVYGFSCEGIPEHGAVGPKGFHVAWQCDSPSAAKERVNNGGPWLTVVEFLQIRLTIN